MNCDIKRSVFRFGCFLGRYFVRLIVTLKPDCNCLSSFMWYWADKVKTRTQSFVSVILESGTRFFAVSATATKYLVHFN